MGAEEPPAGSWQRSVVANKERQRDGARGKFRVFVLTPVFPPLVGGQEFQIHQLCSALMDLGKEALVITRRFEPAHLRRETVGIVPVLRLTAFGETKGTGWRAIPRTLVFLVKILQQLLLRVRRRDIVLVSGFNIMPWVAMLACAVTRSRCIVRPESPLELRYPVGNESRDRMGLRDDAGIVRLLRWWRGLVARRVDCYVAISEEIRKGLLEQHIAASRVVSIPNGLDLERFYPVATERRRELRHLLDLPLGARILIYTGRLALSKGVMMLARVWRELLDVLPSTVLVLVGAGLGSIDDCGGELRGFLNEHRMIGRTLLPGGVSNVNEYLQASDIFVFPSDYEGFGVSIAEAMAVGLPMVSTRVGVAAEVVSRYQPEFLVEPRRPGEFKDALLRLLTDTARQRSIAGRAVSEARQFSMRTVAGRYLELMESLSTGSGSVAVATGLDSGK
jgi:glycosyltransferase involved in cell wall biosynthesis